MIETLLKERLEKSAQEIVDILLPKYKAEAEALLEKAANSLVRQVMQDLVIEDTGDRLVLSIAPKEKLKVAVIDKPV